MLRMDVGRSPSKSPVNELFAVGLAQLSRRWTTEFASNKAGLTATVEWNCILHHE
jgi:hypothetical protein